MSIMADIAGLKVKIFADGADLQGMSAMYANPIVKGFTTNPTLMKAAGVTDYVGFAKKVLAAIPDRPVSFEVFADEFDEMERQALEIASWGRNVNVKIPVTNTKGAFAGPLVSALAKRGVQVNVTAIFTLDQVRAIAEALHADTPAIVSVFAGRIADSGIDPVPLMAEAARILQAKPKAELLWASPRELLNVLQADQVGGGIITATGDIIKKLSLLGKNQAEYSLETVKMFYNDARTVGFQIPTGALVE
jgi:transaldolase